MPVIRGTCGNCGGPVTVPGMWGGRVPPVPRCEDCGATAKNPFGPPMAMEEPRPKEGQIEIVSIADMFFGKPR